MSGKTSIRTILGVVAASVVLAWIVSASFGAKAPSVKAIRGAWVFDAARYHELVPRRAGATDPVAQQYADALYEFTADSIAIGTRSSPGEALACTMERRPPDAYRIMFPEGSGKSGMIFQIEHTGDHERLYLGVPGGMVPLCRPDAAADAADKADAK